MNSLDFGISFGFGLLSSLHCAQMCGPIVLSYSFAGRGSPSSHLLYNLGRMATYACLGLIAGSAGNTVGFLGRMAGCQHVALLVVGTLMILAGIVMSGILPKSGLVRVERFGATQFFSKAIGRLITNSHPASRLGLGALMGFLPCGLLYAALLQAAATGSAWSGALSMVLFSAGTAVSLLAIGLFSTTLGARLGRWNMILAAMSVILMGTLLVWRGLMSGPTLPAQSCHGQS